jgi:hypothetical protein
MNTYTYSDYSCKVSVEIKLYFELWKNNKFVHAYRVKNLDFFVQHLSFCTAQNIRYFPLKFTPYLWNTYMYVRFHFQIFYNHKITVCFSNTGSTHTHVAKTLFRLFLSYYSNIFFQKSNCMRFDQDFWKPLYNPKSTPLNASWLSYLGWFGWALNFTYLKRKTEEGIFT